MKRSVFFALLQYGLAVKNWVDSREEDQCQTRTLVLSLNCPSIFITVKHKLTSLQCGKRSSLKTSSSQRSSIERDHLNRIQGPNLSWTMNVFNYTNSYTVFVLKYPCASLFLESINTTFKQTLTNSVFLYTAISFEQNQ